MQSNPVDDLQELIATLWSASGLGNCVKVARTRSDDGSPHVESRAGLYDIVITERGSETKRIAGLTRPDAARWFVFNMAVGHARALELRERRSPQDASPVSHAPKDDGYSRWNWMAPTMEVMRRISPDFGDWAVKEYAQVLRRSPLSESELRNARYPGSADID
jgi:hypothetical protein